MEEGTSENTGRIMVSSTGSGKGKTLVTSLILKLLKDKGMDVHAFKCGPDYIDPKYHESVLNIPSKNLDSFFMDEPLMKASFFDGAGEINIIEGCMGLYDGIGAGSRASSYETAKILRAPIILCIDARGMGYSLIAQINGFKAADKDELIKGVILNRISESYYKKIAPVIEEECGLKALGFLPLLKEASFDSRHLGLMDPAETKAVEKIEKISREAAETLNIDEIIKIANAAERIDIKHKLTELIGKRQNKDSCIIAVAKDEAFDFYYKDNLTALEAVGGDIRFFSPIHDEKLPAGTAGLYIGGGYPELYKDALTANAGMRRLIKDVLLAGMPAIAECGGFMYLCDKIDDADMVGFFNDEAVMQDGSVRFGYVEGSYKGMKLKGHEFHHYDVKDPGDKFAMISVGSGKEYRAVHVKENVIAGFPHFYFMSAPDFIYDFMDKVRMYSETAENG